MGELLSYSIVSGILMVAMYLAYKIFIARDKQPAFNRLILLSIYFLSFSSFPIFYLFNNLFTPKAGPIINEEKPFIQIQNISEQHIWGTFLIWIFILGIAIVTIKTLLTWVRIIYVI